MIYDNIKPHSKFEYQLEIEELKQRISVLESEIRLLKLRGNKRVDF